MKDSMRNISFWRTDIVVQGLRTKFMMEVRIPLLFLKILLLFLFHRRTLFLWFWLWFGFRRRLWLWLWLATWTESYELLFNTQIFYRRSL